MKKIIKILYISLFIMLVIAPTIFATIGGVQVTPDKNGTETVSNIGNKIAGIIQVVGIFASVIIIMVIGIKYIMGSAEEKAEYKKVLIPYLIGAILLFAASLLAGKIYDWSQILFNSAATKSI